MPVRTAGFDHVHLWVEDVEASLAFYRLAFGAEEAFRVGDRLVFIRLDGGEIIGLDGRSDLQRNPGHVGLRLAEGERLDSAVEEVVGAGGVLLERSEHAPGVPYAHVSDPDGNVIEL
jgi:catechol 2,3-dioxygenase-like lactoylglutathione lyase family enzyme